MVRLDMDVGFSPSLDSGVMYIVIYSFIPTHLNLLIDMDEELCQFHNWNRLIEISCDPEI